MDLRWSEEELRFREKARAFIEACLPSDIRGKVLAHKELAKDDYVRWQKILHANGWMCGSWPAEHGGAGWNQMQLHIFDEECWLAGAPEVLAFGPKMMGPLVIKYGTEAQKADILPRILSSDDWWCQGFSEPGAGSDLASLRTTATIDGDHFVINGQKTWTSFAQYANRIFCLARTDPDAPQQKGISFLYFDMDTPGVTVRPIRLLDGTCEVNEVFLDNVRVPVGNIIGGLNQGWTCAKSLLSDERINAGKLGRTKRELRLLKRIAARPQRNGRRLIDDARFAEKIAQIEVDVLALEYMTLRLIANAAKGKGLGAEASLLKLRGTDIAQAIAALLIDAVGERGRDLGPARPEPGDPTPEALMSQYLNWRKVAIYGGSNEVQRNIIAKSVLRL